MPWLEDGATLVSAASTPPPPQEQHGRWASGRRRFCATDGRARPERQGSQGGPGGDEHEGDREPDTPPDRKAALLTQRIQKLDR
jgi:hypothetical protein